MQTSVEGIALIKRFEGYSDKPYLCPAEKATIGFGHVLKQGEDHLWKGITPEEAEALLRGDLQTIEEDIKATVRVPLCQCQFDALVSLVYNIGIGAFSHSTLLRLINEGEMQAASKQFSRWVYAAGRKLPGLQKRREAERLLFIKDMEI